jgi:hypothetical protein
MTQLNQQNRDTEILWEDEFTLIADCMSKSMGIAQAKKEYIPIENFKTAFSKAKELTEQKEWNSFLFDKSKLNVFHQPSMEWYYTEWKQDLIKLGLSTHYKILPREAWFKASVEAGIKDIKSKYTEVDFSAFTVKYIDSLEEVL